MPFSRVGADEDLELTFSLNLKFSSLVEYPIMPEGYTSGANLYPYLAPEAKLVCYSLWNF